MDQVDEVEKLKTLLCHLDVAPIATEAFAKLGLYLGIVVRMFESEFKFPEDSGAVRGWRRS